MRRGKFKIHREGSGFNKDYWWFTLVAGNGKVIAQSEMYNSKQSCLKGIASVKHNAYHGTTEDSS